MSGGRLGKKYQKLLEYGAISVRFEDPDLFRRAIEEDDPHAVNTFFGLAEAAVHLFLVLTLRKCRNGLKPSKEWADLSKNPKAFNKRLTVLHSAQRAALKLMYNIPDHRPGTVGKRDRAVWETRTKNPSWSFERIAQAYSRKHPEDKVKSNQAHQAYARFNRKIHNRISLALQVVHIGAKASSWSDEESTAKRA